NPNTSPGCTVRLRSRTASLRVEPRYSTRRCSIRIMGSMVKASRGQKTLRLCPELRSRSNSPDTIVLTHQLCPRYAFALPIWRRAHLDTAPKAKRPCSSRGGDEAHSFSTEEAFDFKRSEPCHLGSTWRGASGRGMATRRFTGFHFSRWPSETPAA